MESYSAGGIESALVVEGQFTRADWLAVIKQFNYSCAYCGVETKLSFEHLTPLSREGKNEIGNIAPACIPCNSSKGAKTVEEFVPERAVAIRQRAMVH